MLNFFLICFCRHCGHRPEVEANGWFSHKSTSCDEMKAVFSSPQRGGPHRRNIMTEDLNRVQNFITEHWPYDGEKVASFIKRLQFSSRFSTTRLGVFKYDMVGINEKKGTRRSSLKGIIMRVHIGANPDTKAKVYDVTIDWAEVTMNAQAQIKCVTKKKRLFRGTKKHTDYWARELKAHELMHMYNTARQEWDQMMSSITYPEKPARILPNNHFAKLSKWFEDDQMKIISVLPKALGVVNASTDKPTSIAYALPMPLIHQTIYKELSLSELGVGEVDGNRTIKIYLSADTPQSGRRTFKMEWTQIEYKNKENLYVHGGIYPMEVTIELEATRLFSYIPNPDNYVWDDTQISWGRPLKGEEINSLYTMGRQICEEMLKKSKSKEYY